VKSGTTCWYLSYARNRPLAWHLFACCWWESCLERVDLVMGVKTKVTALTLKIEAQVTEPAMELYFLVCRRIHLGPQLLGKVLGSWYLVAKCWKSVGSVTNDFIKNVIAIIHHTQETDHRLEISVGVLVRFWAEYAKRLIFNCLLIALVEWAVSGCPLPQPGPGCSSLKLYARPVFRRKPDLRVQSLK
jgi:hypothetical protein